MSFGRYDYGAFVSFFAYSSGSVVVPVALVSLAHDLGFPLEHGGLTAGGALHLARTLPMVLSMLLCGFAAGRWGKRRSFAWAVLCMSLGMGLCAMAPSYGVLFLALMLAGAGEGVLEGLGTPFVQDLHPAEPARYINFSHAFWSIGVLVTVLLSGTLLSWGVSWRLIIGGVAVVALIPVAILMFPAAPGHKYPEHPEPRHWKSVIRQIRDIVTVPKFWLFFAAMFLAGGGEFCLTFWCASYVQLHFGAAAWAGGVGTACFAAGMVLGRTGWGYLLKQQHLNRLIVLSALAGASITLFLPTASSLWLLFALLFAAGVCTAPFWPSVQSYSACRMPGSDTTMLFILLSCAGIPGCGFFTWLMGYLGNQTYGLGKALYLVPTCYLTLAFLIAYEWRTESKSA